MPSTPATATPTSNVACLPDVGFLRQAQIIGRREVTPEQAAKNRKVVERARKQGKTRSLPVKPRPAVQGLIPMSNFAWWEGIRSGRYPKSFKLGPRSTGWRVEDIRQLIEQLGKTPAPERAAPREQLGTASGELSRLKAPERVKCPQLIAGV